MLTLLIFGTSSMKEGLSMLFTEITLYEINKIFDKKERKIDYLLRLFEISRIDMQVPRTLRGIDNCIIETWNYEISKDIIREMFFESEKYNKGIAAKDEIDFLIENWREHNLGEIEWPFAAMNFDQHVARLNRNTDISEEEKDSLIATDTIKFRRIKDINTKRNDFIESLIVRYNENIIPTFRHSRGVDFYINGEPFDQKVSRSVGGAFIDKFGEDYYDIAIRNPEFVAISLYENQDEERFDADPRLYVVYLDSDVSTENIERSIMDYDLYEPYDIAFDYYHSNSERLVHKTYCYVILLHN